VKKQNRKSIPYANATSGAAARNEVIKILRGFGCENIGFMDEDDKQGVLLVFKHRGQQYQLRASAKGWAQMYLKQNPWSGYRRDPRQEYEQKWLRQGHVAVNSILRDWVKGMIGAIEAGILSFEALFLPFMLTHDGRTVAERLPETGLLPEPESPKVVSIQGPRGA
jgi:hypothetical protein